MFTVEQEGQVIRMRSPTSTIEILPGCGAILNKWQVQLHGNNWDIIDGYDSPEDFAANCEFKGFRSCKLSPYVCRIPDGGAYSFEGRSYKVGKFDLSGSSIHGLLYNVPFDVAFSEASEEHAMVALQHHYEGTDPGYPFPYFLEVVYYLLEDDMVKLATTFYNQHEGPVPVADGWHPYFSLGRPIDQLHFEMASDNMLVFDERLVPTGALKPENRFEFLNSLEDVALDNCFLLNDPLLGPACSLVNRTDRIALTITPEAGYPYLQVYTPPHRNSIAIENLSAAPDAFNNKMGLQIVEPDEQVFFSTTYQVTEWK
ncbi:MAG TPA: aldose 1-epimerase [Phnomibacter sp.]|nr:aldose 1-epimerase [Phnomibacter sp.]